MSSSEIAIHTCKKHKEVISDIYEMMSAMSEEEIKQQVGVTGLHTRKLDFNLTKLMCFRLIRRYSEGEQDAIICEWDEIDFPVDPSLMQ